MTAMHPDAQRLLDAMRLARRPPFETLTPAQARDIFDAGRTALQRPPEDVAETRDLAVDGPAGPMPVRLYRGAGATGVLPGLLFLHGGGWLLGGLDSHDGVCRRLANAARCWVMALDYRLAPEHPFPAAVEDSAAALAWLAAHAGEIGIDPARLAVGGDSAGGNLAAVLALMGCRGTLPATLYQMLLYPATDLRMQSASFARMAAGVPLTAATMRWFAGNYAPEVVPVGHRGEHRGLAEIGSWFLY